MTYNPTNELPKLNTVYNIVMTTATLYSYFVLFLINQQLYDGWTRKYAHNKGKSVFGIFVKLLIGSRKTPIPKKKMVVIILISKIVAVV